ncbi:hypothetical protein Salat_0502000 [Sesamum alatum]|uniref:Reverse transcriptase n=1 Tax=Sesamum alatum TaxID=300844 RepID=A0AAE1Z4A2_9LAMI|nr:hypothetical protein Salat_0502000 [Sesamum alatum]
MEYLQEFRDVSGLVVSSAKLNIFTASIQQNELDCILEETQFAKGEMPVWYLGIPLVAKRLSITDFSLLIDRIGTCIHKWMAKSLSFVPAETHPFGLFFVIPREHRLIGRKFVTLRKKAALVSDTFNPGMSPYLPEFCGIFTVKQTHCGFSRLTVST